MQLSNQGEPDALAQQAHENVNMARMRAAERMAAEEIGAQDAAAVDYWVQELEREIRAYRRWKWRRNVRRVMRIGFVLAVLVAFATRHAHAFPFWVFGLIAGGAAADAAAGRREQVAGRLAETNDPRAVSVLAIACRDGDEATRPVAERGLMNILPKLQASDARHVNEDGMDALIGLLSRWHDYGLVVAILKALEQIGDERAIPAVQYMTWQQTRSANAAAVVEAARHCLPFLHDRADKARERTTLLRAAENPADPAESLLRPAASGDSIPPEQLLRPAGE